MQVVIQQTLQVGCTDSPLLAIVEDIREAEARKMQFTRRSQTSSGSHNVIVFL